MDLLNGDVGKLKTWQLYLGFVLLQIIVGLAITLLVGVFDLAGIHGALSQTIRQIAVVMNAQPPHRWVSPIAAELKEGNYI